MSLASVQNIISAELDRLNEAIRQRLITSNPLMNQVMESFLQTRGKQIRPTIVLLTAMMLGEINDRTILAATAVELLHSASLIHDDVVDNSMLRRNHPTVNAVWDNHIAVLVGDFFVSTAMQQAIATGDVRIIDSLCHLGKILSVGELDQIYNARYHKIDEETYFSIIEHKTASLFVACARMGCHSVGVDGDRLEAMEEFARLLGLCFQIRDDVFDYYSDTCVGKPTGNDLREGKVTLPLLHVLADTTLPGHDSMNALVASQQLSDTDIAMLIDYAKDNGGIDYAYAKMRSMRDRAMEIILTFPDCEARRGLCGLLDGVITRKY